MSTIKSHNELIANLEKIVKDTIVLDEGSFASFFEVDSSKHRLQKLIINFFPLTQTFALSSFAYKATISKALVSNKTNCEVEKVNLENFLSKVIDITCEEFHLNNKINPTNFHYNVFLRLAPKLELSIDKLKNGGYKYESETKCLVENIRRNFSKSDLLSGLSNIFVIEFCALNIINNLWTIFSDLKDENGNRLYSNYELEHITAHQIIEVRHNKEAHDLIKLIKISESNCNHIFNHVHELSLKMANYFNKLSE